MTRACILFVSYSQTTRCAFAQAHPTILYIATSITKFKYNSYTNIIRLCLFFISSLDRMTDACVINTSVVIDISEQHDSTDKLMTS